MWPLAFSIYLFLKIISWLTCPKAEWWKQTAYLLAWPGMNSDFFKSSNNPPITEWIFATAKFSGGLFLFYLSTFFLDTNPLLGGWIGMVGIIFVLHFGLFHLLANLWRCCNLNAVPIMNWPIVSQNLSEFWGKRWNLAFRDLTNQFIFRPLAPRIGSVNSMLISFFISGLIHDVVISVPAKGGYGGPTVFFLLQALGIHIIRSKFGREKGLQKGIKGRIFCLIFLLLPLPLLFHQQFVYNVIVPFLKDLSC